MELGKREIVWKHDARRAECFHTISSFPNSTSVDITIYQYGKNVLYIFYNIAMSKARRIRTFSVFTSGGKFPVLTLSYINTALSQSAFRIYKCYIINKNCIYIPKQSSRQLCIYTLLAMYLIYTASSPPPPAFPAEVITTHL